MNLVWILRGAFAVLTLGLSLVVVGKFNEDFWIGLLSGVGILIIGGLVIFADCMARKKEISTISAVYFGLLLGVLLGTIFSVALDPFLKSWMPVLEQSKPASEIFRLFITLICCYVSVSILLQTKDE